MPESMSVAAFVVGLVLIVAALVGRQVKIAAVELPDLNRPQRAIVGALGLTLVVFGLLDGQLPAWSIASPPAVGSSHASTPKPSDASTTGECFADVAETNQIQVVLETARETNLRFGSGQPREDVFALQLSNGGNWVGQVKLKTLASGSGFDILGVADSACNSLTTYENATRPNQPQNAPYAFDTMRYHFGDTVMAVELFYKEEGTIELRAQLIAP